MLGEKLFPVREVSTNEKKRMAIAIVKYSGFSQSEKNKLDSPGKGLNLKKILRYQLLKLFADIIIKL